MYMLLDNNTLAAKLQHEKQNNFPSYDIRSKAEQQQKPTKPFFPHGGGSQAKLNHFEKECMIPAYSNFNWK